jgi:hypothetical protein
LFPSLFHKTLALLLATNYFAFQVEVFEEEYERNHRPASETHAFDFPTLNWESFDKNNAPKAFVMVVATTVEYLFSIPPLTFSGYVPVASQSPVRDKSPPTSLVG